MHEPERHEQLLRARCRKAAAPRRRGRNDEQDVVAPKRQDTEADQRQHGDRTQDDGLGAETVVEPAADEGAEGAGDGQQDAEDAELVARQPNTPAP